VSWILGIAAAMAGPQGYAACCEAAGAAPCPSELTVVGPETQFESRDGAWFTPNAMVLSCASGPSSQMVEVTLAKTGREGQILSPHASAAMACFQASCAMPANLCIQRDVGGARIVGCEHGQPATLEDWASSPSDNRVALVLDGRVLVATPEPVTQRAVGDQSDTADLSMPDAPPDPCIPNGQMRATSNDQVDRGDAKRIKGDHAGAMQHYRAALIVDRCNAYAWASLGETLLALDSTSRARLALGYATGLMPKHYRAWASLGQAEESLGRTGAAHQAYMHALELRPGFKIAEDGARRTAQN